jgi:predicted nucleotidyltransferase
VSEDVVVLRAPARFTLAELADLVRPALEAAGVERAIVFGSWARGSADGYSDLDLAIVMETDLPPLDRGSLLADLVRSLPVGLDLLVYTPEEFARGMAGGFGVFDAIAREGVTIHARRQG